MYVVWQLTSICYRSPFLKCWVFFYDVCILLLMSWSALKMFWGATVPLLSLLIAPTRLMGGLDDVIVWWFLLSLASTLLFSTQLGAEQSLANCWDTLGGVSGRSLHGGTLRSLAHFLRGAMSLEASWCPRQCWYLNDIIISLSFWKESSAFVTCVMVFTTVRTECLKLFDHS